MLTRRLSAPLLVGLAALAALVLNLGIALGLGKGQALPAIAIAIVPFALIAFGALTARLRHWLLWIALAANLVPLSFTDEPLPVPGGTQIFLADLLVLLALGSFIAAALIADPDQRPRIPQTPVLGWALAPLVITLAIGVWRGHERYGASLIGQPFRLILYAGIATALSTLTLRQAYRGLTIVFYLGTVMQSFEAARLMATGGSQTDAAVLSTGGTRILALGTAMYLTGALVLALLNLELDERAGRRALHLAVAGLATFGIVVAFGRTTFAAVALIIPLLVLGFQRMRRALVDWLPLIVPMLVLVLLLVAQFQPNLGTMLQDRLTANTSSDFNVRWREKATEATLEGVSDEPVLGVGFGRTTSFDIDQYSFTIQGDPHNSFIYLLAGGGAIALGSFVLLMLVFLWDAWRRFRGSTGLERALVAFAACFWIVFMVNALAGPVLSDANFMLTIWILMALPALVPIRRPGEAVPAPDEEDAGEVDAEAQARASSPA